MRGSKRKAWLEKQREEVRLYTLKLLGDPEVSFVDAAAKISVKFGIKVAASTLAYSHDVVVLPDEAEIRAAQVEATAFTEFMRQNPGVPEERLRKVWFYRRFSSKEFQSAEMKPEKLIEAAQFERSLEIQERKVAAQEERNRLAVREVELEERRVKVLEEKHAVVREKTKQVLNDPKSTRKDFVRAAREIYGLLGEPAGSGQVAAVPGQVGQ